MGTAMGIRAAPTFANILMAKIGGFWLPVILLLPSSSDSKMTFSCYGQDQRIDF
jgi:hypothetical protein